MNRKLRRTIYAAVRANIAAARGIRLRLILEEEEQ
jgi:hypothetical protein